MPVNDSDIQELLIIGAGPQALSLVAALLELSLDPYQEHPENDLLFWTERTNNLYGQFKNPEQIYRAKPDPRYPKPAKSDW